MNFTASNVSTKDAASFLMRNGYAAHEAEIALRIAERYRVYMAETLTICVTQDLDEFTITIVR